jgi:hypothetical protein
MKSASASVVFGILDPRMPGAAKAHRFPGFELQAPTVISIMHRANDGHLDVLENLRQSRYDRDMASARPTAPSVIRKRSQRLQPDGVRSHAFQTDDPALRPIADKVLARERLTFDDAVALYRSPDILAG